MENKCKVKVKLKTTKTKKKRRKVMKFASASSSSRQFLRFDNIEKENNLHLLKLRGKNNSNIANCCDNLKVRHKIVNRNEKFVNEKFEFIDKNVNFCSFLKLRKKKNEMKKNNINFCYLTKFAILFIEILILKQQFVETSRNDRSKRFDNNLQQQSSSSGE